MKLYRQGHSRSITCRVSKSILSITLAVRSQSIDNAVLGTLPKRIVFTMIRNKDFLGSMDTNPYTFRHYDISHFSLLFKGTKIPSGGLPLDTGREK
jgi:hypothetical protein